MKRRELLTQMAKIARSYGVEFDKDHPVHGGRHDKFFVGGRPVEVSPPQRDRRVHRARDLKLRTFERLCVEAAKEDR